MTSTHHMNGGSKGALYRETRQATGSYVVRIVIATAEFAPMPPHWPGYPGGLILTAIRMRFSRHGGIYLVRCGMKTKPQAGSRAASRRSAPNPGSRACREDRAPSHRPQMSSGRLFLDRGARQQSPSPLHRQLHPKTVPGWGTMKWQRTVNSVLTICLSKRGKRNPYRRKNRPLESPSPLAVSQSRIPFCVPTRKAASPRFCARGWSPPCTPHEFSG